MRITTEAQNVGFNDTGLCYSTAVPPDHMGNVTGEVL